MRVDLPPTQSARRQCQAGITSLQALMLHRAAWHIRRKAVGTHTLVPWKWHGQQRCLQHGGSTVILQSLCCHPKVDRSVQNKQIAHEMSSKGLMKVFCFHQHETPPGWISSFSLDKLLAAPSSGMPKSEASPSFHLPLGQNAEVIQLSS